ncbi:DNA-binding transcriptional regulator [Nostoc sp. FACHB-190]|uniref:helix-turn-helix domain-containing protein n=1 Tax=Nostoc sp. FACHB-190 TaxID=2692838 RepID=UPI0016835DDE|nr:helix-turn-helix domain-containing protein [Nostoc sp. FACHB-190]MBD2303309.1 helix-turn-helix domain-containing protein [Nostoc sp. FACHB-190]
MASNYHLKPEEVRRIRRSLGETQAQFASRLGVDAVTVARWETGQRKCTGLYAKTILELDTMSTGEELQMEEDNQENLIRPVELGELYSFCSNTAPLLQFLYKEVPLDYREGILRKYQEWFEVWAYNSSFLDEICNRRLIREIGYFLRPITPGPINPNATEHYAAQKLANSCHSICEIAQNLVPSYELLSAKISSESQLLTTREMMLFIKQILDDLLKQPLLDIKNKGDVVLLKFYRCLFQFAWDEMYQGKCLPIPATVSSGFASILSITLRGPLTISIPDIYDYNELEDINKVTKDSIKGLEKSMLSKAFGISFH